jgi:thiol-disulfide isomerase/thioredoxin
MSWITRGFAFTTLAAGVLAGGGWQGVDKQAALDQLADAAARLGVEELTIELARSLDDGAFVLSDVERLLFEGDPAPRAALAAAARRNLTTENILRNHERWHRDDGGADLQRTSDFLHYRFHLFEGRALLELGRAPEAVERLEAIAGFTSKTALGLSALPYEGPLAKAYNAIGEYEKALEAITPEYAIAGQAWMRPTIEEAYVGAGRDTAGFDEYVAAQRERLSVPMRPFAAVDYEGRAVRYDEVKGDVTILTTWFPGCYGCSLELPFLQELEERHRDSGLRVIAVETTRETATARAYREQNYASATYPFLENGPPGEEVLESYLGANGNGTFLISRSNKVVLAWAGWGKHLEQELEQRVLEELAIR